MRALWVVIAIAGCWTGRAPDPPRWRTAAMPDLLPDGEWGVAVLDVDLDSPAQRANEERARHDPKAARKDATTCQIPSLHLAFAGYAHGDFALALRGAFMRDAMIDCISGIASNRGLPVTRTTLDEREVLDITGTDGSHYFVALGDDVIVGSSGRDLMRRLLAADGRGATADRALAPLIGSARAGGELWAAARVPADTEIANDLLAMLGVHPAGKVETFVASVHVTAPYQIAIELGFAHPEDARLVATALESKRGAMREYADPALLPLFDSVKVAHDGARVRITGRPPSVDWTKVIQALMALRQKWA